jgi:hypothetical protein
MSEPVQIALISTIGAIMVGGVPVIITLINKAGKNTMKAIDDLREFIIGEVDRLERYHSKDHIKVELKKIQDEWIEINDSVISTRLSMYMADNVWLLYDEVATPRYGMEDYQKTKTLSLAIKEASENAGRNEFKLPEEAYKELDQAVKNNLKSTLIGLKKLAEDDIFNNTMVRLESLFLAYAKGYRKDALRIIHKYNL